MPTVKGKKSGGASPSKKKAPAPTRKQRAAKPLKSNKKVSTKKPPSKSRPAAVKHKAPVRKAAGKQKSPRKAAGKLSQKAAAKALPSRASKAVKKLVKKAAGAAKAVNRRVTKAKSSAKSLAQKPLPKPLTAGKPATKSAAVPTRRATAKPSGRVKAAASKGSPQLRSRAALPPAKTRKQPAPAVATKPAEKEPIQDKPKPAAKKAPAPRGARRSRSRVSPSDGPMANWLTPENRPRPSSFIPAPPRAESPSLVAAPPASSDRLLHPESLEDHDPGIRSYPVRVDIEQSAGRIYVVTNPEQLSLRVGEGVEWDFRYLGGADAIVEEVIIDLDKPSPFSKTTFKSHKPGSARPHRQLSGPVLPSAAGNRFQYTIRCQNLIKREIGTGKPYLVVS